ncbi:MAG: hypothetical protein JNK05_30235 [Myxococcales bacterium]|nr:hypothetical protein [Myxococcales bacterium]
MKQPIARFAAVSALVAGCAQRPPSAPVSVAVYVSGDEALAARWPRTLTARLAPTIALRRAELAAPSASTTPATAAAIAAIARAAPLFASAEFAQCSHAFDAVSVDDVLAEGRRDLAARALLWSVACALADERPEDARRFADRLASLELEVPSVVTRPDVESLVSDALARAASRPRVSVSIRSVDGAALAIDGRAAACRAPCRVDLISGVHVVVARAERFEPRTQSVTVTDRPASLVIDLAPASASRASEQWAARGREGAPQDSSASMALLSIAASAPRVALVRSEREPRSTRLHAALVVDGTVASRAELRPAGAASDDDGAALLRELLIRGRVLEPARPVYLSPWFWIGIGAAAATGVGVTAWVFSRPIETTIVFDGR